MSDLNNDAFAPVTFHQRYIIEVGGRAVGLVVQKRGGFEFFASSSAVNALDRRLFVSVRQAEDTCRHILEAGRLTRVTATPGVAFGTRELAAATLGLRS